MASRKPRMPANLRNMADDAIDRHRARVAVPAPHAKTDGVEITGVACPYSNLDKGRWEALLFDAFGTRSSNVVEAALMQMANLAGKCWDNGEWVPDARQFQAVLQLVASMKPENEAQAAYAVMLAATNKAGMDLASNMGSLPDARSVAVLNKTVRTFGDGLEQMKRLQGKRSRAVHQHIHVHRHEGGDDHGGQSHATGGTPLIEGRAALPCDDEEREAVRLPSRKR